MNEQESVQRSLKQLQQNCLLVGGISLILCMLGALFQREQFVRAYLLAYIFWISITLGCLAILLIYHLAGGSWGVVVRRFLEASTRLFPLLLVMCIPLLFGLPVLYPWARPEEVAQDALLQHKSLYLNVPFFLIRLALYFVVWIGGSFLLNRWSREQDRSANPELVRRLQFFSAIGLVLYGLTATFASIDWMMSLEPHWFSTIYGIMFVVGQILLAFAFIIVTLSLLADRKPLSDVVTSAHFHDLGNLLLAFVMLWAYIAFSQYLIIWSGNLPEENEWYLHRMAGGWLWVGRILILFHFFLPFVVLLSRFTKRQPRLLMLVAGLIILVRLVDLYWLIMPAFYPKGFALHWMDIVAPVGLGGLWLAGFLWQVQKEPFLPIHDPNLEEIVEHG